MTDCTCISEAHGHPPGGCPNPALPEEGLCETCLERADADTRGRFGARFGGTFGSTGFDPGSFHTGPPENGGYGSGAYGKGPYGGAGHGSAGSNETPYNEPPPRHPAGESGVLGDAVLGDAVLGSAGPRVDRAIELAAAEAKIEGAVNVPLVGTINAEATVSAQVTGGIWTRNGFTTGQLDKVDRELSLIREFAGAFAAAKSEFGRSHNNPPELVDVPEIDIAALDAGLAAISVIRTQLSNAEPDRTLLELIWRALEVCSGTVARFCRWIGEKTASKAGEYIDNIFDEASKAFGKSIGTPHGITAWGVFICGVANGQDKDLKMLIEVVKAVGTALGHQ